MKKEDIKIFNQEYRVLSKINNNQELYNKSSLSYDKYMEMDKKCKELNPKKFMFSIKKSTCPIILT